MLGEWEAAFWWGEVGGIWDLPGSFDGGSSHIQFQGSDAVLGTCSLASIPLAFSLLKWDLQWPIQWGAHWFLDRSAGQPLAIDTAFAYPLIKGLKSSVFSLLKSWAVGMREWAQEGLQRKWRCSFRRCAVLLGLLNPFFTVHRALPVSSSERISQELSRGRMKI